MGLGELAVITVSRNVTIIQIQAKNQVKNQVKNQTKNQEMNTPILNTTMNILNPFQASLHQFLLQIIEMLTYRKTAALRVRVSMKRETVPRWEMKAVTMD